MKTMKLKGLFLCLVFLLCNATSHAADDLITRQITIKLDKAGTLPDKIGSSKKYKITNLKIVGEINNTDWRLIRDMAGMVNGHASKGSLSVLDLSEAKIVSGGGSYYGYYSHHNDSIGEYAFSGCSGLTRIILPSGVTSIGEGAFESCSGLTSITLPSGVTSIGEGAFESCSGLTSITLPSGVTSIGKCAFRGCSGLTSITLPSGVTSIGERTFEGCSGLTSITLPSGVTSIGWYAFYECNGLTSITLPSGLTSIDGHAFQDCYGLTSINLPSGLTSIGDYAFWDCSCLYNLTIPYSVTSIGPKAFLDCGLRNIHYQIEDDIETYLAKGHLEIPVDCEIEYYLNDKKMSSSVVIPSTITKLGKYVFQNCRDLTSVTVSWQSPIPVGSAFLGVDESKCTLYVPQGTRQDYWLSDSWGDFGEIIEYDPTGIDKVTTSTDAKELSRYSVNGQRLSAPAKGLNVVKYSDGSVKKVVVQ